ncbi:MAG: membrane protein insertase YidC [Gammaproteobacteria bacterium]|nr:membrane protein insertase YidC [Gammaproteobacteria bacterium]
MFSADLQRIILLGALGLIVVMIWQSWLEFQQQYAPARGGVESGRTESIAPGGASNRTGDIRDIPAAPALPSPPAAPGPEEAPQTPPAGGDLIRITTDLVRAQIDPRGGDLVRVELLRHPVSVDKPDEPFVLMHRDHPDLFVAQSGLIGSGREYPNHGVQYSVAQLQYDLGDREMMEVALDWSAPDGVAYQKVFRFRRDTYRIEIDFRVDNRSPEPWNGFVYGQLKQTEVVQESAMGFLGRLPSYQGAAIYTAEEKYEKIDYGDMREADLNRASPSGWVAMMQHYFVAAWLPASAGGHQFFSGVGAAAKPQYRIGYNAVEPVQIAPGERGALSAVLFVGPKEQKRLRRQQAEGLLLTVDYGWFTPIADPLFWLLEKIHGLVGNWGWAIVLLTVLVKAVFYPLSAASYKSMARMKKLQPRLQTLKERYGDDKQKFQQEMMKLYKTEKVNPAGGCLPILVQIPVFIALYWTLLESVELRQADFLLWIRDLSIPDPYFVLPLIMGASMLAQFFLNPAPVDPLQKKIMMAMPIVFTVFFLWFPAGLVLYWVVNNLLSIAQQYYITRKYQHA